MEVGSGPPGGTSVEDSRHADVQDSLHADLVGIGGAMARLCVACNAMLKGRHVTEAAKTLLASRPMAPAEGMDMKEFEKIIGIEDGQDIENRFQPKESPLSLLVHQVTD